MSIDGRNLSPAKERELNELAHATLDTPAGQELLTYLENITLRRPLPASCTDAELRHLEGQRWLVGVLRARLIAGREQQKEPQR